MKKIVIIGASGHGKVVADIAKLNNYEEIIYLDDDISKKNCGDHVIVGKINDIEKFDINYDFFVAIGDNLVRKKISRLLSDKGYRQPTLIHPSAIIDNTAIILEGSVIMAGVIINADVVIKHGVIINTAASIDHECVINDFVHISPGVHIAGNVKIEQNSWIGIGSQIIQNVNIGKNVIVGAGATVIENIENNIIVTGTPAKMLKKKH